MKTMKVVLGIALLSALIASSTFVETKGTISKIKLSFPGKKWALQIELPGFEITKSEISQEHLGRMIMGIRKLENEDAEIIISIFLEKAQKQGDSKVCRDYYWDKLKRSPAKKDDIKTSEKGNIAIQEYMIKEIGGVSINQKHLNAYIAHDDIWIDIHLSKVCWEEKDKKAFDKILSTINIKKLGAKKVIKYDEDFNKQMRVALNYYTQNEWKDAEQALLNLLKTTKNVSTISAWLGNIYYYQKDYPKAIKHYQTTLTLDKAIRFLVDSQLRVVIDNLGMAYGISGNLKKAEKTFQLGITRYTFYPHFYYNMACTYAEGKKNDKALEYLEIAFQKDEFYPEEKLPNVLTDSSFKDLKQDARFRELLKKYNRD